MTNSGIFRRLRLAAFFIGALAVAVSAQWSSPSSADNNGAPIANNGQPVNDLANVIDDASEAQLNQKLKDFMTRTNPPVVISVVTVRTTAGRDPFEYSLAIARGWKIGSKNDDNPSALLFIAVDDRKYQTQISRDLEDELTDGLAGQFQRQYLVPAFKAGDYTKGINDTIDAYIKRIEEKQAAEPTTGATPGGVDTKATPRTTGVSSRSLSNTLIRGACCLIVIIILIAIIFGRSKGGRGGGGSYRGGGGGGSALPWIIGSILANSGSGSSGSSWGSNDGGSSWGGGGGSSDWGGFGGGGDFGGGGSGGSW